MWENLKKLAGAPVSSQESEELTRKLYITKEKYVKLKEKHNQLLRKFQESGLNDTDEALKIANSRLSKQIAELNVLVSFERAEMLKEFQHKDQEILKKQADLHAKQQRLDLENEKIREKYIALDLHEENLE